MSEHWDCPCGASNSGDGPCWSCKTPREQVLQALAAAAAIPIVTTPSMQGFSIQAYLGIVTAEVVMGIHMFKDLSAGLRDIFGGRSASYQEELQKGKGQALKELADAAMKIGANAVVGTSLDYEAGLGNMLMIVAKGTAVTIEKTSVP